MDSRAIGNDEDYSIDIVWYSEGRIDVHIGYGSLYNKTKWEDGLYVDSDRFLEIKRGLFFKASYLWRL